MADKQTTPVREYVFKFLIIGDYGVGKTAIVRRYSEGKFSSNYKITIGADFSLKRILWEDDTKLSLQLWDIAGHEKFGYMTRVYYKHAMGCVVVFDMTRYTTFESVYKWLMDIRQKVVLEGGGELPVVVFANKADVDEACVSPETLDSFCRDHHVSAWFPTSAKTNFNIDEGMNTLIREAIRTVKEKSSRDAGAAQGSSLRLDRRASAHRRSSHCCQ